jgi:hypothetical protein
MYEAIGIVVFMGIVVGLAAGILFVLDRLTLRPHLSEEERRTLVEKRTRRWQHAWGAFYLFCAMIALIVNTLTLEHETLRQRIGWTVPALMVVIWFLFSRGHNNDEDRENKNEE